MIPNSSEETQTPEVPQEITSLPKDPVLSGTTSPEGTNPKEQTRPTLVKEESMYSYFKLSAVGKLFFASVIAGVLFGKKSPFKLRATPQQVKAMTNALIASKAFQDELKKPGATVDTVIQKLNLRHLTAAEFERTTNRPFPL